MKKIFKLAWLLMIPVAFFACSQGDLKVVASETTNNYKIVLLSPSGSITEGSGQFYLVFYDSRNNKLVDVGSVIVRAEMPMPGMPMVNDAQVKMTDMGRYTIKYNLTMRGTWTLNIKFNQTQSITMTITVI